MEKIIYLLEYTDCDGTEIHDASFDRDKIVGFIKGNYKGEVLDEGDGSYLIKDKDIGNIFMNVLEVEVS